MKQLQENYLLIGSRSVVNIRKLGYQSYHVFVEVHTPSEENKILDRAKTAPFVNAIITYSGKYNLEISIMARDDKEFLGLYEQLIDGVRIRDDHVLVLLETLASQVLPTKYFPEMKDLSHPKFTAASKKKKHKHHENLDKLDLQILFGLSKNANVTNIALAKELGVSKDTITYRVDKLQSAGYLVSYRPVVNYSALGLSINSVLLKLNHKKETIAKFEESLKANGSILWATKTMGYYNYLIYVITKDLDEFHGVINQMKQQFDNIMKTYEILFAFEELKYTYMAKSIVDGFS